MSGKQWTFEEFCRVWGSDRADAARVAEELGRTVGAVEAVWASVDAVTAGKATASFPGRKWEDFVARAQAGECRYDEAATATGARAGCLASIFGRGLS